MTRKINAENIKVLFLSTTVMSSAIGAIGSYPLHVLYPHLNVNVLFNIGMLFCIVHTPLAFAAQDSLRQEFGLKWPIKIIGNSFSSGRTKRKIPFNANGKDGNIFMSTIPFLETNQPELESFTVQIDNVEYTVSLIEMESFVRVAWNRQRAGKLGLSRTYWTKRRRPRLKTLEYNARMNILLSIPGLILDRGQGRSGRLANSPLLTISQLV